MAATAIATASYSTLSPKHNLSLSINHLNKNSALSVSSSRPTKIPKKVSTTTIATPVIKSSKSSFDDVASSLAKRATMMLIKILKAATIVNARLQKPGFTNVVIEVVEAKTLLTADIGVYTKPEVFICEQKLYTKAQLEQHKNTGDSQVDGTESKRGGFKGHVLFKFCRSWFYEDNELYRHIETEHYHCSICKGQNIGKYDYYKNYVDLEKIWRTSEVEKNSFLVFIVVALSCNVPSKWIGNNRQQHQYNIRSRM